MSVDQAWNSPHAWGLFARRALFIFAITLPFDIRDAERDAGAHVRTLPHILGTSSTRTLAWGVMACCLLLDMFNTQSVVHFLGSACAVVWTCVLLFPMTRPRHDMYYACGLDGAMLTHTACILFALMW
jgi:1,4-dihydroxy-2-naphthoate octaprenyltransferase